MPILTENFGPKAYANTTAFSVVSASVVFRY